MAVLAARSPAELLLLILVSVAPALALLGYGMRTAPTGESPRRIITALLAGAGAFGLAVVLDALLPSTASDGEAWYRALAAAGPREEILVVLAGLLAAPRPRRMERLSSGIMPLIAAGLGFAAVESLAYGLRFGPLATLARAVTANPAHVLHPALVGVALGRVHRTRDLRRAWMGVLAALVAAILAHGLYDLLLMQRGLGRFGLIAFLLLEAAVVLALLNRARAHDEGADLDDLGRVPLLAEAGVGVPTLRLLLGHARRQAARAGSRVVRQGAGSDALYLVLRGALVARRDDLDLGALGPGDVFGGAGLLTGAPRNADVVARQDSLLMRVPRAALLEAIAASEDLADRLIAVAWRHGARELPSPEELEEEARRAASQHEARMMLDEATARLMALPLLRGAPPGAVATLAQGLEEWTVPAGRRLVRDGRSGPGLCLVLAGEFEVRHRGAVVATLSPGAWFGEISVLAGVPATADVVAGSPGELAVLDWPALHKAIGLHPELGLALLETLLDRVEELSGSGAELDRRSALGRLMSTLTASDSLEYGVEPDSTMASVLDALATRAHLNIAALRALAEATLRTKEALWALGPDGLRRVHDDLGSEERGLGRPELLDALARSPEVVRVLAMQALRGAA